MPLLNKIIDKLFPIKLSVRIFAAQFSTPGGFRAFLNTEEEQLVFMPMNMPVNCFPMLGGNPENMRLLVSKDETILLNLETSKKLTLNFRERRMIQAAMVEWLEMGGTSVSPIPRP